MTERTVYLVIRKDYDWCESMGNEESSTRVAAYASRSDADAWTAEYAEIGETYSGPPYVDKRPTGVWPRFEIEELKLYDSRSTDQ
jgi:hypothetical protein